MMAFTIRPAEAADKPFVLALVPRLRDFAGAKFRANSALDAGEKRVLNAYFEQWPADKHIWVAERDAAVLGAAYAERLTDYFTQERYAHLGILMVAKAAEGQGIGGGLLQTVEQWACAEGFRFLTLNVFAQNVRALGFYERAAFQPDFIRMVKLLSEDNPLHKAEPSADPESQRGAPAPCGLPWAACNDLIYIKCRGAHMRVPLG